MSFSPLIDELINALRYLPGVGPKSAQRMAFYLLARGRNQAKLLARALEEAATKVQHCKRCRTYCEEDLCRFCSDTRRDDDTVCVVESPADMLAIEQTHTYRGRYFVLAGHLSPLDGIGPQEIGMPDLINYVKQYAPQEMILATNPTVEGEATAHYIAELFKDNTIKISRIAHGVPLGGELEFIDAGTIARAFLQRGKII